MKLPSCRTVFLAVFLGCSAMMAVGLYFQFVMGLEPCPLCITQRIFIILAGFIGLLGAIHGPGPTGNRIYAALITLSALIGGGFSSRQLWLQSLPADQVPACGPGLSYLVETLPLSEVLAVMMSGTGNCAEIQWTLLGVSIPGWTLFCLLIIAATAAWTACRH